MIIHHSHGLHKGVANRRAHKSKPSFFKSLTYDFAELNAAVLGTAKGLAAHKAPDKLIKRAKLLLDLNGRFCIFDHGIDFKPVSNDAFVL